MKFLGRDYPQLVQGYQQLYARKYAPDAYRNEVRALVDMLQEKYRLSRARREQPPGPGSVAQPRFNW
jgi:hypothetical protein